MRSQQILRAGLLMLVLASCVPSQAIRQSSPLPTTEKPPQAIPSQLPFRNTPLPADTSSSPPPAEKFVDLAKQDLASHLSIDVDQIALVEATPMIWPDAALGCPSPGQVYAQGRAPGYQITLEAKGAEYVYHTDQTGKIVLCPEVGPDEVSPPSPAKPIPTPTIHVGVPIK